MGLKALSPKKKNAGTAKSPKKQPTGGKKTAVRKSTVKKKSILKTAKKVAAKKAAKRNAPKKQASKGGGSKVATGAKKAVNSNKTASAKKSASSKKTQLTQARKSTAKKVANSSMEKKRSASKSGRAQASPKTSITKTTSKALTKSNPSASDLEKFKLLLLAIRHRIIGDVNMMSAEALGGEGSAGGNSAPIHPAEVGTHSFEQEFTLNFLSSDGDRLHQIEAALEKIADGTYGACEECGGRIPKARLEAIPDTPFCVKCASQLESSN